MTVHEDKKLLKCMAIYGVKDNKPLQLKHALTNKMNDNVIVGRFSIPQRRPDMLIADCFLPDQEGIPASQIISALRLFARVVPVAIHACDDEELVE